MDLNPSEKQEILLFKACKNNGGSLPIQLARSAYSSKNSASSVIDTLEMGGYIERVAPGVWEVEKVTQDVKEELAHLQDEDEEEDE